MGIGERIKELRVNKEVTQEELCKKIGVKNRSSLANWEANRITPDYETLQKIASYFGVTIDYIINGTSADLLPGGKVAIYVENDKLVDISELPPENRQQVLDYIKFIKTQYLTKK